MATAAEVKKSLEFDALERSWIRIAIQNQIKMIGRARTKELVGGDVWILRGKEMETLQAIAGKV